MWALLGLWMFAAVLLGTPVARVALRNEDRVCVFLAYGALAGHVTLSVVLIALWGPVSLGTAYFVTVGIAIVGGGVFFLVRLEDLWPHRLGSRWGMQVRDTALVLVLVALFAFLGHKLSITWYSAGNPELRFFHSSVVERMTHERFPPTNPLEPDDSLRYRFGYHAFAAAIRSNVDALAPDVLAAVTSVLLPLIVLALVGAAIRSLESPRPGVVAALIGLFGGSLLPWHTFATLLVGTGPSSLDQRYVTTGMVWEGNTIDMIGASPTIAVGFVTFCVAAWLSAEGLYATRSSLASRIVAVLALAYLGLMNEVHFILLASGIMGWSILDLTRQWQIDRSPKSHYLVAPIAILCAAYSIVCLRGGLSGGIAIFGAGQNTVQMVLNTDHFGEVPGPPVIPGTYWIPLLSLETVFDTDFAYVGVPLLLFAACRSRNAFAGRALLASAAGLMVWATTYSYLRPADSYRIGQAALTIYVTVLPFAAAPFYKEASHTSRLRTWVAPLIVAALVTPHLGSTGRTVAFPPTPIHLLAFSPDVQASSYLRQYPGTARVLVPLRTPSGDVKDLYDDSGPGSAAADILALTGDSVPMGHMVQLNKFAYLPDYRDASLLFDRASFDNLNLDWVYVLPAYLSNEQLVNLHSAQDRGDVRLAATFGEQGTDSERQLLRVIR